MFKRFVKLIYVLALTGIGVSLPVYYFSNVKFDLVYFDTYQAKCLNNNKYVVLQGSSQPYQFDDWDLRVDNDLSLKRDLNFYCQYYEQIQPHISRYLKAQNPSETRLANMDFFQFKDGVISNVFAFPEVYELVSVKRAFMADYLFGPIINWAVYALSIFAVIQFLRVCYIYIVFGKIIWHPFKLQEYLE